jgi:type I restriction enzyme, S subunit
MNKIVRLGDICDLKNGFAFKSNDYVEKSNTLNIRMSNIRPDGNFDEMHKARYLPDSFSEKYKEFLLKDNDLIIAMTDMAGDPKILGLPTIVKNSNERKFLLNQRVGKLHKFSNEIYVPYLCYFLKTLKNYFKNKGAGGLQVNISKQEILSTNIILKPIVEQKKIVTKLDAIFSKIDKAVNLDKQKLLNIDSFKTAVLKNEFDKSSKKVKFKNLVIAYWLLAA